MKLIKLLALSALAALAGAKLLTPDETEAVGIVPAELTKADLASPFESVSLHFS